MYAQLERRLAYLQATEIKSLLRTGKKGVEKESLRVSPRTDRLAKTPHPPALGSALTHPYIVTDYSEAQLELVTPPLEDVDALLHFQSDLHRYIYANLGDELLWSTSMPCVVADEMSVPIARFGTSNQGRMKHIYRRGLELRYRRIMQIISGVHFNYSIPESIWPYLQQMEGNRDDEQEFMSAAYFGLSRNALRYEWLVTYLFGCSPAMCKSFWAGLMGPFSELDSHTDFELYATSLRMSNVGYKNQAPEMLSVSYDSLSAYVSSLHHAVGTPWPAYAAKGIEVDGEYRQLNANILQIENEFYGSIRPKQIAVNGERPLLALARRGVRYVEMRSLDVNAFEPVGVSAEQLRFLEAFLLFCLLHESPKMGRRSEEEAQHNQALVALKGRMPGLQLLQHGAERPLQTWALELLDRIEDLCDLLDTDLPDRPYTHALQLQREAVLDSKRTPSARMLAAMHETDEPFYHFAHLMSEQHRLTFLADPADPELMQRYAELAARSLREHAELEARPQLAFDEYLRQFDAQLADVTW